MTYKEWKTKYEYYEIPEDGWPLCNFDRAEIATEMREDLRQTYPDYFKKYLQEHSTKENK